MKEPHGKISQLCFLNEHYEWDFAAITIRLCL
jgi:hypothetical protein